MTWEVRGLVDEIIRRIQFLFAMQKMKEKVVAQLKTKHEVILATIPKRYYCTKIELFSSITYNVLSSEHPAMMALRIHVQNKSPTIINTLGLQLQLIEDAEINKFFKKHTERQTFV